MRVISITIFLIFSTLAFADSGESNYLTRLDQPIEKEWKHHKFINETAYTLVEDEGRAAIKAQGQLSASGLYKEISYSLKKYPWIQWQWKAETIHRSSNLSITDKQDMALGVFVIFPHWLIPWKTRVIAYVWVGANHQRGDIVRGKHSTFIVLRVGTENSGKWIGESRNVYQDYRELFGEYPTNNPENLALFTDNDQTLEPVVGYYGAIKVQKKSVLPIRPE
ncbi:MAG: DUF3047 domain-containing protein [Proteobacteria bacterium]|nr:DUF3047 domain-containing protein [Pseudomonadota bacterium]